MEAVYGALKLGYNVVFSDVDIAILRDPLKYLFIPGVDYVHSTNKGCNVKWRFNESMEGNTGKSFVRPAKSFDTVSLYTSCEIYTSTGASKPCGIQST
jgi:hypothetical protein